MPAPRLFKLSTSQEWEATTDCLSGHLLSSDEPPFGLSWEDLNEDMIFIASSRWSVGIDLGWYPDFSAEGEFLIEMVDLNNLTETYARPLREFRTRSVWTAKQTIEDWMNEISRSHAEPGTAPNGGPARLHGSSGHTEGPPSVS